MNNMSHEINHQYPNRPLGPEELLATQMETLPEEVFMAVNGLIAERLRGKYARFTVNALRKRMTELGLDQDEIVERGWDRIGSIYKSAGWEVRYNTPASDDDIDFEPYYYFTTNGQRRW